MTKLYNNRYVKKQSSNQTVNYYRNAGNGKFVEFLICIVIGAMVTSALALMSITFYEFAVYAKSDMDQQQQYQIDYYNSILSD